MDTIFALASARGKSGVAVIRVSGPDAFSGTQKLVASLPELRKAGLRDVVALDGEVLDQSLVLCFPEGSSFTGEKTVEIQCHGSVSVVSRILSELSKLEGFRSAEAGEFSRRALENDRMSLDEIEGLADLIEAETEAQRRQAQRLLFGELGKRVELWRTDLLRSMALLEATIDFVDEDVPVDVYPEVKSLVGKVRIELDEEVAGSRVAERVRDGFRVAIVGPPNSGKSTLLNYLARRDVSITSDVPGTTRDLIEVRMDLEGVPVTFVDTAGIREAADEVEAIGVSRTLEAAETADLRLHLLLADQDVPLVSVKDGDLVLRGKCDRGRANGVSGRTGAGVDVALENIRRVLGDLVLGVGAAANARHREALCSARFDLDRVWLFLKDGTDVEIISEELRAAVNSLDVVIGNIGVEDVLGEIFGRFCIGK